MLVPYSKTAWLGSTKTILMIFLAALIWTDVSVFTQVKRSDQGTASLIKRYEYGASQYRIVEDVLKIRREPEESKRQLVAIRVCSRQSLPVALFQAAIDPFDTAEYLRDYYAYVPGRIFFLRSEDCLSSNDSHTEAAEIWMASTKEALPQSIESYSLDQLRRVSLGTNGSNRVSRAYQKALRTLIKRLRSDPGSLGIIVGYYLEHPDPLLKQRIRDSQSRLKQSGLPDGRYYTVLSRWHKGDSGYPNSEPQYPDVFIVKITNTVKQE
jgi:hypothetical protein